VCGVCEFQNVHEVKLLHKLNCTRQLHESFVIEQLCKCEVEPTENCVLLKTNFKVPKLIIS
jgi:hypothetical protein